MGLTPRIPLPGVILAYYEQESRPLRILFDRAEDGHMRWSIDSIKV